MARHLTRASLITKYLVDANANSDPDPSGTRDHEGGLAVRIRHGAGRLRATADETRHRLYHRPDDDEDSRAEGVREEDPRGEGVRVSRGQAADAGHRGHGARVRRSGVRRRVAPDAAAPGEGSKTDRQGAQGAPPCDRGGGGMTAVNLVSYSAQIAVLVLACAALPRVLGLRSPGIQYLFWRALFAICVLLPLLQPWRHELMEFVAAPSAAALLSTAATPNPAPAHSLMPRLSLTVIGALLLAGVGARLAWLSAGVLRLRWMRDSATDRADSFAGLQQTIGVVADIRWSGVVRHPVTFGVVHPIVLLPIALRSADDSAQRAVVAHELHHVKRRDWACVVGEEVVRSGFCFHPAMWWLVSRVQLARETVVDELSILTTNARRAYIDTLFAFADDGGLAPSTAFSARRHLFHRVM